MVLEGLVEAPFKPLESAEAKNLSLMVAFLLAITSLRRVGYLQVLSKSHGCLEFAPGDIKAILHPRPGYVPKVPSNVATVLQVFHPPPHVTADDLICSALSELSRFVQRSSSWRKSDQLLVCFGLSKKGLPAFQTDHQ